MEAPRRLRLIRRLRPAVICGLVAAVALSIGAAAARAVTIDEFPAPGGPFGISSGPDGNIWFTQLELDQVGRMSTAGMILGETQATGSGVGDIIAGPDGNLWFTELDSDSVGRVATDGSPVLPGVDLPDLSEPVGLAVGSDGNVWVTEPGQSTIAPITPAGDRGMATMLPGGRLAEGITAGPDGALWFTEPDDNRIGRLTTEVDPADRDLTEYILPNPDSGPLDIVAGPDGALWFTEGDGNRIGRITTTGTISEFPVPTPDSGPEGITLGPDGNLWFTEANVGNVARITPSGSITEFPVPTPDSEPVGIAAGADGRVWFTELSGNQIGRITLDPPGAETGAATSITTTSAVLTGTVDANASATTYRFEYGTTTAYGSSTPITSAGAGDAPVAVNAQLSNLGPGVTYHYRLVATSPVGTSFGADRTFTAVAPPPPELPPAPPPPPPQPAPVGGPPRLTAGPITRIRPTTATINATLNPNGVATSYAAECGRSTRYGTRTSPQDAGAGTSDQAISVGLSGLRPRTRYHCRLVATNAAGTAFGADRTFRTPARLRLVFPRRVSVAAEQPITLRYRSTAAAEIVGELVRAGSRRAAAATRQVRAQAKRGVNRLRLRALEAGRYRLTVRARTRDGQRATRRVSIRALAPPPMPVTG
jgi:streptogramin lyase